MVIGLFVNSVRMFRYCRRSVNVEGYFHRDGNGYINPAAVLVSALVVGLLGSR